MTATLSLAQATRQSGLSRATLAALLRAGVLAGSHDARGGARFNRADLALLQALAAVPRPVVRRAAVRLAALRAAGSRVAACGGRIVVSERDGSLWDIESGQRMLPLDTLPTVLIWKPRHAPAPPHPTASAALLPLGALLAGGQNARAAAVARRALRGAPDDPRLHLQHGMALHRLRRWHAAQRAYERAVELDPRLADAYRQLALLLVETGQMQRALRMAHHWRRLRAPQGAPDDGMA